MHLERSGCTNVGVMHIRTRQDAMNDEYIERIRHCDAVMFTGGNQLRLSVTDGGTEFLAILKEKIHGGRFFDCRNFCRRHGHEQYHDL